MHMMLRAPWSQLGIRSCRFSSRGGPRVRRWGSTAARWAPASAAPSLLGPSACRGRGVVVSDPVLWDLVGITHRIGLAPPQRLPAWRPPACAARLSQHIAGPPVLDGRGRHVPCSGPWPRLAAHRFRVLAPRRRAAPPGFHSSESLRPSSAPFRIGILIPNRILVAIRRRTCTAGQANINTTGVNMWNLWESAVPLKRHFLYAGTPEEDFQFLRHAMITLAT